VTRWPWFILLLAGLISVAWIGGSRSGKCVAAPVDSVRVVRIRDTIHVIDSVERVHLTAKRHRIHAAPLAEVIDSLPDDPTDTSAPELVRPGVIRATADSLETCRFERDSTARQVTLWQTRAQAQDEARRICEAKPIPVYPIPPSRLTWAAIGGATVAIITTAIMIVTR
jgi:hypothetical protein